MHLPTLGQQNVERWAPEPAQSRSGSGFVVRLYVAIKKSMLSLAKCLSAAPEDVRRRSRDEFERFVLWGQGLSMDDGRLDQILMHSKELHCRVLSLFLRLGTTVLQCLSHHEIVSPALTEQFEDLRSLLSATEIMLQDPEVPGTAPRPCTPTFSGSDISDYGTSDLLDEISVYIDCLLDLSTCLENPALDVQPDDAEGLITSPKEVFSVSSSEELIYCRRIRDRFEHLPLFLVERLAQANTVRATTIRQRRSLSLKPVLPLEPSDDHVTESLFSSTGQQITKSTNPTILSSSEGFTHPSSTWSKPSAYGARAAEFDDDVSEATFASFSTTASNVGMGRPRVPAMPDVRDGKLDCPICFLTVTNVKTRNEWKKHVFNDLKPYVCTIEVCNSPALLFNHSTAWAKHEQSHGGLGSKSPACCFCSATYQERGPAYFKHLSAHLREVALSILPQQIEDDDDDVSDSSDPPSVPVSRASSLSSSNNPKLLQAVEDSIRRLILPELQELKKEQERPGKGSDQSWETLSTNYTNSTPTYELSVVGDLHGQYSDLLEWFRLGGFPPTRKYLFLGNYVNYGEGGIETLSLLLAYKLRCPTNIFLLRGNHESASMTHKHGFENECRSRYSVELWKAFCNVFDRLPAAAIVGQQIFCVHGGISPYFESLDDIRNMRRPAVVDHHGLLGDMLWSSPDQDITEWNPSPGGRGFVFGPDVVSDFLEEHYLHFIVRGNQVVPRGYDVFTGNKLVSLWSAPNFQGGGNLASVMDVDTSLRCSFRTLASDLKALE
ncbi:Metallo-dependent phosphatase-like protein [Echria macrotheca]|uniref:Serine/threonine-protein phosphatase n=1 Tax=Echria macrotheca TaxID=438768 RepID=A0AAJ0F4M3_9PEZI|nr:Metallo-dependent phosphatase-like protein [Echria macrotheca]